MGAWRAKQQLLTRAEELEQGELAAEGNSSSLSWTWNIVGAVTSGALSATMPVLLVSVEAGCCAEPEPPRL